jgi:hypothetical protein
LNSRDFALKLSKWATAAIVVGGGGGGRGDGDGVVAAIADIVVVNRCLTNIGRTSEF